VIVMTRSTRLALLGLLAVLVCAPGAQAAGKDVIRDCTDDEVMSKTYTAKEYRDALKELAADADQYGNCRDVILRAQRAALASGNKGDGGGAGGGSNGGGGAIGSAPGAEQLDKASAPERKAVEQASTTPAGPVTLQNTSVDPAKVGTAPGFSQVADLPTSLAILLALLLAGTLAIGGLRIRRLVDARRA
jgi:hypothetical protein